MVTRDEVFNSHTKYLLNRESKAEGNIVMSGHFVPSRTQIVQIVDELESDEEEVIMFACRDQASNFIVSELLSELNEGNSYPVILEVLNLLKRYDLIRKHYKMTKVQVETLLKTQSRVISDYRCLMIELNEQIEEDELESLVFLLKNKLRNGEKLKIKTFLALIVELEKNQLVMPSKLDLLENMFQTIHRVDLKNRILKFQQKDSNCGGSYINAIPASPSFNGKSSASSSSMKPQLECSSNKGAIPVQETLLQFHQQTNSVRTACSVAYIDRTGDCDERYLVRKESMGFCVIIDCVGNDSEMLQFLFRSQNFVVQCHLYKKVDEVKTILQDVANMEQHRNHDIFACVLISRGNSDSLFCLDGNSPGLSLDRIKNFFTGKSCPNLRGKPKLFFILNYFDSNIEEEQEQRFVEVDAPREDAASHQEIQKHSTIPNEADIFWSHCRVDELELQGSSGSTSFYLRSLRDLLHEKGNRKYRDLLDIHTELNRIIYTKQAGYFLQLRHTLTKKLFLYPAYH